MGIPLCHLITKFYIPHLEVKVLEELTVSTIYGFKVETFQIVGCRLPHTVFRSGPPSKYWSVMILLISVDPTRTAVLA